MRRDLCKELVQKAVKKYPKAWQYLVPEWAKRIAWGEKVKEPYPDWEDGC